MSLRRTIRKAGMLVYTWRKVVEERSHTCLLERFCVGFLEDEEGPVSFIELHCLKQKVGSGTQLEQNPDHLTHDDAMCPISNIAGPLDGEPIRRSTNYEVPKYEDVVRMYNSTCELFIVSVCF